MKVFIKPTILFCIIFLSFVATGQPKKCDDKMRLSAAKATFEKKQIDPIIDELFTLLEEKISVMKDSSQKAQYRKDQTDITNSYNDFTYQKKACDLSEFHYFANKIAVKNNLSFDIRFTTKNPGARIKYRSFDGATTPCDQLTNSCLVSGLAIGTYEFWSERNGKRTSQVYQKTFLDDTTFEIEENE